MPEPVPSGSPATPTEVRWDDRKNVDWAEKVLVAAGGKWKRKDVGTANERLELDVDCPTCHDPGTSGVVYLRSGVKTLAEEKPPEIAPVFCQCGPEHAGRPQGLRGCGAWGDVTVAT